MNRGIRVATETEGFARLLRRLKERSGRSYGVLAGQLHMSVSTLHRYCNGDAVPVDFGPAERLARLCGANREEMVELHRLWIVADDGRRRGRSASAAAAATAETAATATHSAPPRGAGSDTAAGAPARSGTSAPAAPEPNSPESEGPSDRPDHACDPAPVTPDTAIAPGAPRSAAATTPNTSPPTTTAPTAPTAPCTEGDTKAAAVSPTRSRLRFALAALALVSLAVPAALAFEGERGLTAAGTRVPPQARRPPAAIPPRPPRRPPPPDLPPRSTPRPRRQAQARPHHVRPPGSLRREPPLHGRR